MADVVQLHSASSAPKDDMTLTRVEEEITSHKRALCDLYFRKNSFTPIFRLPTETLQAIFIHLAREFYDKEEACSTMPDWVNVSYICRHWRRVALNCPTLWSYLFILSSRWTEELLTRSKLASLHVNLNLYRDDKSLASRFVKQVAMHTERIQELCLVFENDNHLIVQSFLLSRAPRLTNLSITALRGPYSEWPSVPFNGDTTMLCTLNLSWCPMSWYSLKVTGLKNLHLRYVPGRFQQNTVDFLAMLRCMHSLTSLELDDALSSPVDSLSGAAVQAFQKIDLPHLSRLQVNAPTLTVITLLHYLDIPLKTLVRLRCTFEPGLSLDDYAPLLLLLARRFGTSDVQAPSSIIIRSLGVAFRWNTVTFAFGILKHGCSIPASHTVEMWDHNVPLRTAIHFNSDRDNANFINDICYSIPLTDVENLWVSNPPSLSDFWRETLGHLQGVRYLKLEEGRLPDLAPLLSVGCGEDQGGYPDKEYAPVLEKLELYGLSFTSLTSASSHFDDVQLLCDALSRRKDSKGLLIVDHCTTSLIIKGHTVDASLDMIGRWEDGRFHVVEGSAEPCWSDSQDSEESDGYRSSW